MPALACGGISTIDANTRTDELKLRFLEVLVNLATLLIIGVALYLLWPVIATRGRDPNVPVPQAGIVGSVISALPVSTADAGSIDSISFTGASTVLYVFSTECQYCESQKELIGERLVRLTKDGVRVLTASREPLAVTSGYWGQRQIEVISMPAEGLTALRLRAVPMLYMIDSQGVAQKAFLGPVSGWSEEQFRSELFH